MRPTAEGGGSPSDQHASQPDSRPVLDVYTVGWKGRSAEEFFETLRAAGIRRLIDVRINNRSQLAGFTKQRDLAYFLRTILGVEYQHRPELAPTRELLSDYRQGRIDWAEYERRFLALIEQRRIEELLDPEEFSTPTVLLCTEPGPTHCHRRLLVEYLAERWQDRVGGLVAHHL